MTKFGPDQWGDVEYDPASKTYRVTHDWADADSLSTTLATALAVVTGRPAHRLRPLYDVVDPDALDRLFRTGSDGDPLTTGRARFPYGGYEVTVRASGEIEIAESDPEGTSPREG